ncbi:CD99 molecule isoform X2 [Polypterus senegalus]|uniref:CD99 molecule isoform X2 n=1 Tax=Polypterus senegalus TaxID=55291 RepID=UPI001966BDDB|nr:CD99 molecule isoform X2 [Polypterus senegalus]
MLTLRIVFFFCLVLTVSGQGFDLSDAFDEPPKTTPKPPVKIPDAPPKNPSSDFDLEDAFGGGIDPKPTVKPPVKNPGSSGGNFGDSDLNDVVGEDGYQPDKGKGGPRVGPAQDDEQQYEEGGAQEGGKVAGIVGAVAMAVVGAASSYFAYQKKKLCFKQGDVESANKGQRGTNSALQVFSSLLQHNTA